MDHANGEIADRIEQCKLVEATAIPVGAGGFQPSQASMSAGPAQAETTSISWLVATVGPARRGRMPTVATRPAPLAGALEDVEKILTDHEPASNGRGYLLSRLGAYGAGATGRSVAHGLVLTQVWEEFSHARYDGVGSRCGEAFELAGFVGVPDAKDAGVAGTFDVAEGVADQDAIGRVRAEFLDRAGDQVRVRLEQVGVWLGATDDPGEHRC